MTNAKTQSTSKESGLLFPVSDFTNPTDLVVKLRAPGDPLSQLAKNKSLL